MTSEEKPILDTKPHVDLTPTTHLPTKVFNPVEVKVDVEVTKVTTPGQGDLSELTLHQSHLTLTNLSLNFFRL